MVFIQKLLLMNISFARYAGHSKWANIKHIKGLKDAQRGQLFTKFSQQIKVAIQEGQSDDILKNLKLKQIVDQAKKANMPINSIQNVIKSTQVKKDGKKYLLEIRGPGNAMILCELFTDNVIKSKSFINILLRKHNCVYNDGAKNLFEFKTIIDTKVPINISSETEDKILENATEHAIELSCEDVEFVKEYNEENQIDESFLRFICHPQMLQKTENILKEKYNYEIISSFEEYIPLKHVNISDKDLDACEAFLQKLECQPEVINIYTNISYN